MTTPTLPVTVRAACADADGELFFRGDKEMDWHARRRAEGLARDYCAVCPVIHACHAMAERFDTEGLWAGQWRERTYSRAAATIRVHNLLDTDDEPVQAA